jgi:hypothetical protein
MTMKALTIATTFAGVLIGNVALAQIPPFALARCDAEPPVLGTIQLPHAVLADGKPLEAGTYQVRLTNERPTPAVGQSPNAECWVEFIKSGAVAGREVATVISSDEVAAIAKGPGPKPDDARVDVLKGGDYIRAWINHVRVDYIINLPVGREARL